MVKCGREKEHTRLLFQILEVFHMREAMDPLSQEVVVPENVISKIKINVEMTVIIAIKEN